MRKIAKDKRSLHCVFESKIGGDSSGAHCTVKQFFLLQLLVLPIPQVYTQLQKLPKVLFLHPWHHGGCLHTYSLSYPDNL